MQIDWLFVFVVVFLLILFTCSTSLHTESVYCDVTEPRINRSEKKSHTTHLQNSVSADIKGEPSRNFCSSNFNFITAIVRKCPICHHSFWPAHSCSLHQAGCCCFCLFCFLLLFWSNLFVWNFITYCRTRTSLAGNSACQEESDEFVGVDPGIFFFFHILTFSPMLAVLSASRQTHWHPMLTQYYRDVEFRFRS